MKRLLLPLLASLASTTSVNAEIFEELHKKCLEVWDSAEYLKTNKKLSHKKDSKIFGIEINLFLIVILLN